MKRGGWVQKPVKYHGLVNQGATCYLNSVLQVLFMTEDFKERVKRHNSKTEYIDYELTELFSDLEKYPAYTFKITKKLKIGNVYEQRDAAEHYEKILRLTSPEASEIFHGELINRSKCLKCNTQTESEAGFWHLPLPLVDSNNDYSVEKGIEDFFRPIVISGEDQMYCEKCDEKHDADLDCVFKNYPEVLVLLLKRFEFDYSYMTYVKINRAVNVPQILHIGLPQNQFYELYAVVEHFGELRYGHYIATIKSQDDGEWYIFDDSKIYSSNALPKMERSQSAYLLFYRKQKAPVPDVMNQTSVPPLTDTTIKTEDTSDTSGEEEKDTTESVRPTQKRAKSSDERGSAEDAQVKKQKQELSDQVVPQAATGEEYEEGNTDRNIDNNIQDLGYSVCGLAQQTHNPNVSIQDDSERANSDMNQLPPKGDDSIVKTQNDEGNSSPVTTKEPSELVTRGEKVQSVSKLFLGLEYDSQNLGNQTATGSDPGTQDCKDYVSGDGNSGHSPVLSRESVFSESIDIKYVPGGEHVNIGEGNQAGVRGSLEKTYLQQNVSCKQECAYEDQNIENCSQQNQSNIGAHVLGETGQRSRYDPVGIHKITKDGSAKPVTSVPVDASREPSLTKATMDECDQIEERIQGNQKQQTTNGCEMVKSEDDVPGYTSHMTHNDPSLGLSIVPMRRIDSKEYFITSEVGKNDLAGEKAAEDQAEMTEMSVGLEKIAQQPKPTSDQYVEQQGKETKVPEDQSDFGDLAEIKVRGSHEIMNNGKDVTPDLGLMTVNRIDLGQVNDVHRNKTEQTQEEEQMNEREKFVGVTVQGTRNTESEDAACMKSVSLCETTMGNVNDEEKMKNGNNDHEVNKKYVDVETDKTNEKRLLTKYDLYLESVKRCTKIHQPIVPKCAQTSEKLDRKK